MSDEAKKSSTKCPVFALPPSAGSALPVAGTERVPDERLRDADADDETHEGHRGAVLQRLRALEGRAQRKDGERRDREDRVEVPTPATRFRRREQQVLASSTEDSLPFQRSF